ncbi:MAG: hypothetical protein SVT56_09255 [Chloroflexota bacterium]|nr:hypothetical protein [Chloroflexota bacterium]
MLSADVVQVVSVNMKTAQLSHYLTPSILESRGYIVQVIDLVPEGNFIPLSSLLFSDNPEAENQTSLSLDDPNLVAMVIPVTSLTCPPDIKPGDRVDITMDIGSASFMTGAFSSEPTSVSNSSYSSSRPSAISEDGSDASIDNPILSPLPTSTSEASLSLPVTKTITRAEVLKVIYEVQMSGTVTGEESPETGEITGLVVAVQAGAQEAISFAIHNGEVRVTILSPGAEEKLATAGMSWEDIVDYFKWNRQLWLAGSEIIESDIDAPGASVLYPTLMATYSPSPTMRPTVTATPELEGIEGEPQPTLEPSPTPDAGG